MVFINGGMTMVSHVKSIMAVAILIVFIFSTTGCARTEIPDTGKVTDSCSNDIENQKGISGGTGNEGENNEVIELKFHHHDPAYSFAGRFFESWAREVSDASEGTLKITVYPDSELGAAKDAYDMVINGTADIAWGIQAYFPGRFPLSDVFTLHMLGIEDAEKASQIFWDLYTKTDYLKPEYAPFKVLFLYCHADVPISMKNIQIKSASDLAGKRIRVAGRSTKEFMSVLGASPISVPATDINFTLEKGVLDGVVADWHLLRSFNIIGQTNYYLDARLYEGSMFCIMNQKVYDSLPEKAKKAIDEKSGQYAVTLAGRTWQAVRQETLDAIRANNGVITDMTPELAKEFKKAAETVWENWITVNEKKGLPAREVFEYVRNAASKK